MLGAETAPSSPMLFAPMRLSQGVGKKVRDRHYFTWHNHHTGWTSQQCQGPRCLEPGALPTTNEWEGDCVRVGVHLLRHLQILVASFPEHFPPDHIAELKCDHFHGGLPKWLKQWWHTSKQGVMRRHITIASEWCGRLRRRKQWNHPATHPQPAPASPEWWAFFPLQKLKGSQPAMTPSAWVAHLEKGECWQGGMHQQQNLDGIELVTKEFIVHLARVVKVAQQDEKHCYHLSSWDHFICDCPLVAESRTNSHLNWKEGTAPKKEA